MRFYLCLFGSQLLFLIFDSKLRASMGIKNFNKPPHFLLPQKKLGKWKDNNNFKKIIRTKVSSDCNKIHFKY